MDACRIIRNSEETTLAGWGSEVEAHWKTQNPGRENSNLIWWTLAL